MAEVLYNKEQIKELSANATKKGGEALKKAGTVKETEETDFWRQKRVSEGKPQLERLCLLCLRRRAARI